MSGERGPRGESVFRKSPEVRLGNEGVRFIDGQLSPEQMERTQQELAAFVADPSRYIDKGGAGSVHRLSGGVCFKAMDARRLSPHADLMDIGNHVAVEAQYLGGMSKLNVRGARTCKCYGFYPSTRVEDQDYLLMEELDAVNLQHVLNGTVEAPESFDPETFLEIYSDFLEELHRHGVAHGDVAPRNVMIDRETGNPRIIDFGRSQRIPDRGKGRSELVDKDMADYNFVYEAVEKKFNLA